MTPSSILIGMKNPRKKHSAQDPRSGSPLIPLIRTKDCRFQNYNLFDRRILASLRNTRDLLDNIRIAPHRVGRIPASKCFDLLRPKCQRNFLAGHRCRMTDPEKVEILQFGTGFELLIPRIERNIQDLPKYSLRKNQSLSHYCRCQHCRAFGLPAPLDPHNSPDLHQCNRKVHSTLCPGCRFQTSTGSAWSNRWCQRSIRAMPGRKRSARFDRSKFLRGMVFGSQNRIQTRSARRWHWCSSSGL